MKLNKIFQILIAFIFLIPAISHAAIKDFSALKSVPVLDNGRLKPLDTFARSLLTQLSGKDHYHKEGAIDWLAKLLFNPDATLDDKVILINNPEIATALGIPPQSDRRYTPKQLQQAYRVLAQLREAADKISEKERSVAENEIIRVLDAVNLYADLSRSMVFAFAQDEFTISSTDIKDKLGLPKDRNQYTFLDLALKADSFDLKNPVLAQLANRLFHFSQDYKNMPLTVIPTNQGSQWLSPWDALNSDFTQESSRKLVILWNNMAEAYNQGNDVAFNIAAHLYLDIVRGNMSREDLKKASRFSLELFYDQNSLFTWAIMFYILAFIFFIISFSSTLKQWYNLGLGSVVLGFVVHLIGLILRIIIMARPPVASLYETFIFVGLIAVFLGLMIELYSRQWLGIVTAAICGAALLFIANKYSVEGDTFKMLIAVLNSNFWLATHVTTITMGYAATCVGGILGHIWLVQSALKRDAATLDKTYKITLGILGVSLTLTFLGTNLGGIWADQSWGRFWGWDPKENGALMIVLWTAMLFHAKVANMIGPKGLAIGAVLGMMVVMWAWFGVNLLSVGLHSYGFTSGVATSLIAYVIFELVFLSITAAFRSKK